jgi:F-type H+-transporting ATPase subunit b
MVICAMALILCAGQFAAAAVEPGDAAGQPAQAVRGAPEMIHPPAADAAHSSEEGTPGELVPIEPANQRQSLITAVWVVAIFVVLLAILYPTAWKGVLAGLKQREEHIRKDIADAEAARLRAEATLKQYNTQLAAAEQSVRDMIAKAMADGEKMATTIRQKATEEAEQVRVKATADIEAAKKQAIIEIHSQTAELATAIAEKIIRKNLNVDDQRDLGRASLGELQKQSNN